MNKQFLIPILAIGSFQQFILAMQSQENPKIDWLLVNGTSKRVNRQLIAGQNSKKIMSDYYALRAVVRKQDYFTTLLLLERGIDPNPPSNKNEPIWYAQTVRLTELLIKYGARIPKDILDDRCAWSNYPLELINFYLERGYALSRKNCARSPLYKIAQKPIVLVPSEQPRSFGLFRGVSTSGNLMYFDPICEPKDELKARLTKARLFLEMGFSACDQDETYGWTVLHHAASLQDLNYCEFLVQHETVKQKEFLTFLLCLKQIYPRFYLQKDLLRSLWQSSSPERLLSMKDADGKTACDYIDPFFGRPWWLEPKVKI